MTNYKSGDIILVDFGFSEGVGSKKRPALIISSNNYHKSRQEIVVLAITHNIKRELLGDTKIEEWEKAGLLYPSLVTGIVRTIKDNMITRKLGTLLQKDLEQVKENFKKILCF